MRRLFAAAAACVFCFPLFVGSDASAGASAGATISGWPDLMTPPERQGGGEKDAAVVVGVSDYAYVPDIPGAAENAAAWVAWLVRARQVPLARVKLVRDREATDIEIRRSARGAASQVQPGGTLWFVFIGHGAPTRDGRDGVLVGHEARQQAEDLYARSVPRAELVDLLASGPQARTVLVLDACFSGQASGAGGSLVEDMPLIPTALPALKAPNVLVLTAGGPNEFAGPLPGVGRPAFSYLLLGALRGWADRDPDVGDRDGQVTVREAHDYVTGALAAAMKGRTQRPALDGSAADTTLAQGAKEQGPDLLSLLLATPGPERRAEVAEDGRLAVTGAPAGAQVDLRCAGGFTRVFGLPGTLAVPRGTCTVRVTSDGYEPFEREVPVAGGQTASVEARLAAVHGGVEWLRIPGGTFDMGSTAGKDDERPPHRVQIASFELAKTEVTVAQYRACADAGACSEPHWDDGTCSVWNGSSWSEERLPATFRGADQPVVCVDWAQAVAYSRWVGGRLPSEAEWEYAARSGGRPCVYPWGDEDATCHRAVMDDPRGGGCGLGSTAPVCSRPTGNSAQGACDLAGNVGEWVQDWHHWSYAGAPTDGSAWEAPAGSFRVCRGGSWNVTAPDVRAACRSGVAPPFCYDGLGFRPARSVP